MGSRLPFTTFSSTTYMQSGGMSSDFGQGPRDLFFLLFLALLAAREAIFNTPITCILRDRAITARMLILAERGDDSMSTLSSSSPSSPLILSPPSSSSSSSLSSNASTSFAPSKCLYLSSPYSDISTSSRSCLAMAFAAITTPFFVLTAYSNLAKFCFISNCCSSFRTSYASSFLLNFFSPGRPGMKKPCLYNIGRSSSDDGCTGDSDFNLARPFAACCCSAYPLHCPNVRLNAVSPPLTTAVPYNFL
mmetsp:Transcript_42982/g.111047  ORF Transcript_42982/g.111047 Transcript_42982/m.111047 type:complete len:248 (+) Transcript_42982:402-1145(+)